MTQPIAGGTGNPNAPAPATRRRRLLIGFSVALALAGIAYGIYWFTYGRFYVSTDDAYVAGNRVAVTSEEPGTVTEIMVDSTDAVRAGQPVVQLDTLNARLTLDRAKAQLALAARHIQKLFSGLPALHAEARSARAAAALAARNWQRAQQLVRVGALSRAGLELARTRLARAQALAARTLARLRQTHDLLHGTAVNNQPAVLSAESAVRQAYVALERKTIRAPVSGYVAKRSVELGEQVAPGRPLMIIVPLAQVWVDANFKERELRDIRIGQPVRVTADWYGSSVVFHGRVAGIEPGSGSAFSLLPPENASGNWIKVVQRVPVRIAIDASALAKHPLRIGLSAEVSISVRHHTGSTLALRPPEVPRYRTTIYAGLDHRADQLITRILRANLIEARH
ncbi:MAG: HlyD family secretion protein [Acidiferrobacteraceae bacterium]